MSKRERLYKFLEERDPMQLDEDGNYYIRHVEAMTGEGLYAKSDIAAELGWRDREIDRAEQREMDHKDTIKRLTDEKAELVKVLKKIGYATLTGQEAGRVARNVLANYSGEET